MKAVTHLGGLGWHSNNRGKEREKRRGDSFSGSFEKGCLEESVPVQKTEALSVGFLLFSGNALKSAAWLESTADTVSSRQEKKKTLPLDEPQMVQVGSAILTCLFTALQSCCFRSLQRKGVARRMQLLLAGTSQTDGRFPAGALVRLAGTRCLWLEWPAGWAISVPTYQVGSSEQWSYESLFG